MDNKPPSIGTKWINTITGNIHIDNPGEIGSDDITDDGTWDLTEDGLQAGVTITGGGITMAGTSPYLIMSGTSPYINVSGTGANIRSGTGRSPDFSYTASSGKTSKAKYKLPV